jgi:hypothetical protein
MAASPALTGAPTAPTQTTGDASTDIATDAFVSTAVANAIAGVNPAVAVLAASTANLTGSYVQVGGGIGDTFTITATGAFTLDGIAINAIGQRVLLKNQSTASQNGVYTATIVGTTGVSAVFTRALDYDTVSDVNNTGAIPVQSGTVNATTSWLLTSQVTSIGSSGSSLTYAQFTYAPSSLVTGASANQTLGTPVAGGIGYGVSATQIGTTAALTQYGVLFSGGTGAPTSSAQGGSNFPLIGQGASNPVFSTIAYPTSLTSGGVVGATSTTQLASSAAWAAGGIGYGLGAGSVPVATAAGTAKQIVLSGGAGAPTMIDFPERYMIPAANCNNTTAGAGWSIPSGGTVTCRAGTNNLGGYITITDTSSTFAQFQVSLPGDWDTATLPYILFGLMSTDTTSGHTIIPAIKVSCPTATNGTSSDDVTFAASHSATTITIGGSANAHGFYTTSVQTNSTDMSGCVAGGFMIVQVGRATDTASTANFYYADVTFPRLLVVGAQ